MAARDFITTHVLDTSTGAPASGIRIILQRALEVDRFDSWETIGETTTNQDGRGPGMCPEIVPVGTYKAIFHTKEYFDRQGARSFYPQVEVIFLIADNSVDAHYHVPLLLSPFGYSTYRGS